MTKEEFNKLPKQERINLVCDRIRLTIYADLSKNKTANVVKKFAKISESPTWMRVCDNYSPSEWFAKTCKRFLGDKYGDITIAYLTNEDKTTICAFVESKKEKNIIPLDDIPDELLDILMFNRIPKGTQRAEYLDEFDSYAMLMPQMVYGMSKSIPMDMDEYIGLSRKLGHWATKLDVATQKLQDVAIGLGDELDKVVEAYGRRNRKRKKNIFIFTAIAVILAILILII